MKDAVERAGQAYDAIGRFTRLDTQSNRDHLLPIRDGLDLFAKLAELGDTAPDSV